MITQSIVGRAGCAQWGTTLAFSFIGGGCWFFSACLVSQTSLQALAYREPHTYTKQQGLYVCTQYPKERSPDSEGSIFQITKRIARLRRKYKPGAPGTVSKDAAEATTQPAGNQV